MSGGDVGAGLAPRPPPSGRSGRCRRRRPPEAGFSGGCGPRRWGGWGRGGGPSRWCACKGFVVGAAVDPHAPQKDAGVVAALADHLAAVLQSLGFPAVVAEVLPAGHFREDEMPSSSQASRKAGPGGTVAGADGVAAQLLFSAAGHPAAGCCPAWHSPDRRSSGGDSGPAAPPAGR